MPKIARYALNLKDYDITQARAISGFVVIKNGNESDLVSDEVSEFVFADRILKFDEIYQLSKPNEQKTIFKFKNVKFNAQRIFGLKIAIEGYDENLDAVKFELDGLKLREPYRYAISNGRFEMSLNLDEQAEAIEYFWEKFEYGLGGDVGREPAVKIYINESLVYEKICK